jgi:AcrR family transcriptional regulator
MSVAAINIGGDVSRCQHYDLNMSRWGPDARGRLAQAALELYGERGFDQTTAAEIANRAGLTERTFFRHFADKREVLFAGSAELQKLLVAAVASAPTSAAPIDAVTAALMAAGDVFNDERRSYARERRAVIAANADLHERELIKMASLASAIAEALQRRGVSEPAASLAAEAGIAIFRVTFERWVDKASDQVWRVLVHRSLEELKVLVS